MRRVQLQILLLGALWGSSYIFIQLALEGLPPAAVAFGRQFIAASALSFFAFRTLRTMRGEELWRLVLVAVTMVAAPMLLIAYGQQFISASLAGVLVASTPLLTALFALGLDHTQRSTPTQLVGIVIGLLGVCLIFGLDLSGSAKQILGSLLVLLASVSYAIAGFLVKRYFPKTSSLSLVGCTSAISAILLLPLMLTKVSSIANPPAISLVSLTALGLGGTALGWYLYYSIIQSSGPRIASLAQYLAPFFTVVFSILFLKNVPTTVVLLGLGLILSGSYVASSNRGSTKNLSKIPPFES